MGTPEPTQEQQLTSSDDDWHCAACGMPFRYDHGRSDHNRAQCEYAQARRRERDAVREHGFGDKPAGLHGVFTNDEYDDARRTGPPVCGTHGGKWHNTDTGCQHDECRSEGRLQSFPRCEWKDDGCGGEILVITEGPYKGYRLAAPGSERNAQ